MKVRRAKYIGLFAHYLGIRPWEFDLLTVAETMALCRFVDEMNKPAEA